MGRHKVKSVGIYEHLTPEQRKFVTRFNTVQGFIYGLKEHEIDDEDFKQVLKSIKELAHKIHGKVGVNTKHGYIRGPKTEFEKFIEQIHLKPEDV